MNKDRPGEARLEVALAQAIINEVKYGTETSQLAEVSLLAAFQNRVVGGKLVQALLLLMPGLKYFSIGALLKDGVVVRTSNLAVEGPVDIHPQSLRGSAARVAARKNTIFHTKKRPEEETGVKYYELQEAWEQSKSTSVLSVPIPAVRTYESASIADTPPALEETASDPTSHVCPVLHSLHGAVGMVTVGLATEDIDLDGRQGKAIQGIAQSLSPFLAYYAAPVLKQLQDQIRTVANSNAASVAKFKAQHQGTHPDQPSHKRSSTDGSEVYQPRENAISPFSTGPYPPEAKRHSGSGAVDSAGHPLVPRPPRAGAPTSAHAAGQGSNPFAQVATVAFSQRCPDGSEYDNQSNLQAAVGSEPQQQPVSPFAAAAQASGRLFDDHVGAAKAASQQAQPVHNSLVSEFGSGGGLREGPSSTGTQYDLNEASSSETAGPMPVSGRHEDPDCYPLDTYYVFKRRPILSSHVRRYSTTTFQHGVCGTPTHHFNHVTGVAEVIEERPEDVAQHESVVVDDFSYASLLPHINRRALSTPQDCAANGPLEAVEFQQQMLAHASCPGPILLEIPYSNQPMLDGAAKASAAHTHIALQGHISKTGHQSGVMFGKSVSIGSVASGSTHEEASSVHRSPSRFSQQVMATEPAGREAAVNDAAVNDAAVNDAAVCRNDKAVFDSFSSSEHRNATGSFTKEVFPEDRNATGIFTKEFGPQKPSEHVSQHPLWMTFSEPELEKGFDLWFSQRCSKVDTIFMLAATIYITQLLFFTWALADQQAEKWPLLGYIMLPVLMLQHGDAAWYLKNRSSILAVMRLLLLAFAAFVVPSIVQGPPASATKWMDMSGIGPLVVIPLGLMVRFKTHVVLHAISCASLVVPGLQTCLAQTYSASHSCNAASLQKLAVATCAPTMLLYFVERRARVIYRQTAK